jgi:hypothetical protein
MLSNTTRKRLGASFVLGLAAVACCLGIPRRTAALAQEATTDRMQTAQFFGAGSCKQCHQAPTPDNPAVFVELTEYETWSSQDKHSLAYAVLLGPIGKRMGEILGNDPQYVLKSEAGCLVCHAMDFPKARQGTQFTIEDGVSCDGCHGPSQDWIGAHAADKQNWRKKSAADKQKLGMRDLRNPAIKADLCLSCHVGNTNEGKVVTHPMYAAGHPPLPAFELATFCKNLPQHWFDIKKIPLLTTDASLQPLYHWDMRDVQHTQEEFVGSGSNLHAQLHLIAERANTQAMDRTKAFPELTLFKNAKDPAAIWPQIAMGQSDCYACHHDLQRWPSWREQRGYNVPFLNTLIKGVGGRPQMRPWTLSLLEVSLRAAQQGGNASQVSGKLAEHLQALYTACDEVPFGTPAKVRDAAQAAHGDAAEVVKELSAAKLDPAAAQNLLQLLTRLPDNYTPDFDSARQIASAIQVIYVELSPKTQQDAKIKDLLGSLVKGLDIWPGMGPNPLPDERKALILQQIAPKTIKDVDHTTLRKALLEPKFLDEYQKLRNKELDSNLRAIMNYDPVSFKKTLAELGQLLPAQGGR